MYVCQVFRLILFVFNNKSSIRKDLKVIDTKRNTLTGNKAKKFICLELKTNSCYSYHVKESQYKYICNYLPNITLRGHTVIDCESVMSSKKGKDGTILYLLEMHRAGTTQSRCITKKLSLDESARIKQSKWLYLPQSIVFGKQKGDDLEGARALTSGVSRPPSEIEFSSKNFIYNLCFVLLKCNLVSEHEGVLIRYNEQDQEFTYTLLPTRSALRHCENRAFFCLSNHILLFGGYNYKSRKCLDTIQMYQITQRKLLSSFYKLPIPLIELLSSYHGIFTRLEGEARKRLKIIILSLIGVDYIYVYIMHFIEK
ncbi:hypothetical protein RFI_13305 [Reticulomyxa filosa]|uniref:Uncharacterized protein n=1 Tax=Reticulomyxa filosa TaxID=46433 RepID=X6NDB6_RETFI|nr:hypothetical protein RFI_13305 [Reticulomyxa filosa]|eukprot:ETO23863.1 hypothetical protein RFI_13305 [Reticulomyxa filosa]